MQGCVIFKMIHPSLWYDGHVVCLIIYYLLYKVMPRDCNTPDR